MPVKGLRSVTKRKRVLPVRMTEEEFERWCDEDVRAEFVDGEVIILTPEATEDEDIRWWLGGILGIYIRRLELGKVYGPNLQVRLRPGLRRVSDLIFIAKHRLHLLRRTRLEGAPDLAVEIVSEDSEERDFRTKFVEYEAYGVREYWLIVPMSERIYAHRRGRDGKFKPIPMVGGILRSAVVKGFWFKVEWLWEQPDELEVLRQLKVL